ncbi:MAG TPA: 5-formyltetrahydrofolate cyclo-ligase, partial [Gammaproteobacteria bacterium]|nr:5-formyltetrahydrofolate cyclo-ligase [Gammaproteobacteria bacterium]
YGLAFDCQEVAKLNTKPWDVPLDAVVTPTTIYR